MKKADVAVNKFLAGNLLRKIRRRFQRKGIFISLNKGTDYIALFALFCKIADKIKCPLRKFRGYKIGFYRNSVFRHFVEHRNVKVAIKNERKSSGNRSCRHNYGMGRLALFAQGSSLANAETVLLVGYDKTEIFKFNIFLNKSMGSGNNGYFAGFYGGFHRVFFGSFHGTGKNAHFYSERSKHFFKACFMLVCKNFRWCHHCALESVFCRKIHCGCSNCGFSGADIALDKTAHGHRRAHIFFAFRNNAFLSTGKFKPKGFFKFFRAQIFKSISVSGSAFAFNKAHSKGEGKEFFKNKAFLRLFKSLFAGREMNISYSFRF